MQTYGEEWQPGIVANINGNCNYLEAALNYWAPLNSQIGDNKNGSTETFDPDKDITINQGEIIQMSTEQPYESEEQQDFQ